MSTLRNLALFLALFISFSSTLITSYVYAQEPPLIFLAEDLPPYHYIDSEGRVAGALVEIVQAMLTQANLTGKIEIQPFARSYHNTQNQENIFMFSLLKTPDREDKFQWIGQTYQSSAVLVGLNDSKDIKLSTLEDAKAFTVGTIRGYHSDHFLQENGFLENKNLSLSVNNKQMWGMLFNNRIDLVLTNNMAIDIEIKKAGFDAEKVTSYLSLSNFPSELYIATGLKTSKVINEQLSTALLAIKKSGVHQAILANYNL